MFRQLLKRSLEKRKGWKHVEDYSNGAIGLEACMENPPDLLLVDLQLPGKHGLDIVGELLPDIASYDELRATHFITKGKVQWRGKWSV